ncbi:uncharacterized protein LOC107791699 isoform X2 [Nicotiana tabacum]|uniref:Uncharacterized protein LOC107791699 isoform X2 n=2 Tax=Nicotiana TaxID=4085 RepID=A0A1S3ZY73_TOBAC|nr:PREDICTED: uncharacterized protein LOC104211003 isoform X2 [Nicotiana sylvestris]XP_016469289.1 PREDICTED: uncharacterized protein LOC107791699 isoform X2 [Nicotiana tabacum]
MEILWCRNVKGLEIDAPNLMSFKYIGPDILLPFQNFPQLSELTTGSQYCYSFIFNADKHESYSCKLRKLKLKAMRESWLTLHYPDNFPRPNNLRELELDLTLEAGESLLFFTFFIKAASLLSRFRARIIYIPALHKQYVGIGVRILERAAREATAGFVHKRLKVVKLIGFTGRRTDYKLALHLLEIGRGSLKKIILQPTNDSHGIKIKRVTLIEKRSKQLEAKLPPGAKLVMLYSFKFFLAYNFKYFLNY